MLLLHRAPAAAFAAAPAAAAAAVAADAAGIKLPLFFSVYVFFK